MSGYSAKSVWKADHGGASDSDCRKVGFRVILGVILLSFWTITGCKSAPPAEPAASEDLFIRQVSEIPGYPKQALFEGAKLWLAAGFSSDLDVIQYANRDQGTIIGKTSFPYSRPSRWGQTERFDFRFTVMVETRDHRIRTTFSDMALVGFHGFENIRKDDMEAIRPQLAAAVEALVASFHREESLQDEW
ncbi:DUF4468 domain-containing protein [Desulfococcus multivorans]|uniref:DUF4468 domain-containing protein n=2 Tax=Desulfococcaceae TaxID=2931039 RepID=S7UX92_DESML|nr:DUF4468 domain-containing protein [Desulfococcus multivorans]AOY57721.1 uncharacterized protein Dmul_09460 [Desulfococcus multivorans]EPR38804.1 hypothetical protein dsmv_0214 [Desulfococcus multivorans DSM 2059]SJZ79805.1 protein of unknown function [Desulfococcus multivorans DSM 2059]